MSSQVLEHLEKLVRCQSPTSDLSACQAVTKLAAEIANEVLNTPAQIPTILRFMADERGEDIDELATAISNNCERLFGSFA